MVGVLGRLTIDVRLCSRFLLLLHLLLLCSRLLLHSRLLLCSSLLLLHRLPIRAGGQPLPPVVLVVLLSRGVHQVLHVGPGGGGDA